MASISQKRSFHAAAIFKCPLSGYLHNHFHRSAYVVNKFSLVSTLNNLAFSIIGSSQSLFSAPPFHVSSPRPLLSLALPPTLGAWVSPKSQNQRLTVCMDTRPDPFGLFSCHSAGFYCREVSDHRSNSNSYSRRK